MGNSEAGHTETGTPVSCGEVCARLDLSGRDPTQGFCIINQQPKSNLKTPLKIFNPCQKGE